MVTPRTRALTHALTLTHTRAHTHTALTRWFELGCVRGDGELFGGGGSGGGSGCGGGGGGALVPWCVRTTHV